MDFEKEFEKLLNLCDPRLVSTTNGFENVTNQLAKMMTEIERLQEVERQYIAASK